MVKIGSRTVDGATVKYQGSALMVTFPNSLDFAHLEAMYGSAATIEVTNSDAAELYYSKGLVAMSKADGFASLTYTVTTIGPDVADELQAGIDGAENATLDLAEMVCTHEEQIAELWAAVFPEKEEANG